jgi:hypothetical protein
MIDYVLFRPNGKMYRPRKPPRAELIGDDYDSIIVLGTWDVELAVKTAQVLLDRELGSDFVPIDPDRGWYEKKYRSSKLIWCHDADRGQAGIIFEIADLGFAAVAAHP